MRKDQSVDLPRSSGILLHPTSLPSGTLDREAYRFVDWLAAAGQSWWQVLPLGPPDEFGSPYRVAVGLRRLARLLAEPDARVTAAEIEDFVARHPYWTGEWARFAGGEALADQVRFEREWGALRAYAAERGVRLIGDLPIYVSDDGADVVGWPELFERREVAGAPPDALSANGQHWGNPLYDWPVHRATGYRWWIERFRRTFELVDLCRVDHFRGFVSYWAIPARNKTAASGRWRRGPGAELFRAVERELGGLPVIAEDLGVITPPVYRLRDELGLPGMVVLLWAFSPPTEQPAPAREPPPQPGRLHEHARHGHGRRLVRGPHAEAACRHGPRPARAELGPDRARLLLARGARDRAGAGRARARQRGAHEPARRRERELELAARARRSSRRRSRGGSANSQSSTGGLRDREVDRARRAGADAVDRERRSASASRSSASGTARRGTPSTPSRARRRAPGRARRSPAEPASSGSLRTAAAKMIGVARRNAKRAASLCESPTSRPPPIAAPEREKPGMSAIAWAAPTAPACPQPTVRAIRVSSSSATTGARRRSSSAP